MKNFIFQGAFVALFCMIFSSVSFAKHFDGGGQLLLVISKQNQNVIGVNIPDIYLTENGNFKLPLQVKISMDNKIVATIIGQDSILFLPEIDRKKGEYFIEISIGDFFEKRKILFL